MRSHPTRAHPIALFLFILLCAGNVAFAGNSDQIKYHLRGKSAHASFHFPDASGCIWTSIFFSAVEDVSQYPGIDRSSSAYIAVTLLVVDRCDGWRWLFYSNDSRTVEPGMLAFKGNLGGATAMADFALYDQVSGIVHTLDIDLTWTGIGQHWAGGWRESSQEPGFRYDARFDGSSREAETIGTVLLDGAALPAGTEISATLNNSRNSYIEISRQD